MSMKLDDLYSQYHSKVSRYLSSIVGSTEAEDLAQDVFLKVGGKLGELKDPSKVSAWIFKIALNTARDRLRQPAVRRHVENCSDASAGENSTDAIEQAADTSLRAADEQLARNEMIRCFVDFVEKLPKNYFDVYRLSEFEDLPNRTISKRLSLPLHTVKIRLHRARTMLYQELRVNCRCYRNGHGELMGERRQ